MAFHEVSIAHWKKNAPLIYDTLGVLDSKPVNTQCVQWGGKLEPLNKIDRRMELLYARNYTSSSTKKTCGIGVSVLDVRRPLKSTEDAVTKEADRVSNGGAGGATLVHQRLLDNGAEVKDAEVNRIRYLEPGLGQPSFVVAKTDHACIPVWNLTQSEPVDGVESPCCVLKGMNKPSLYSLGVSAPTCSVIASDRQTGDVPGRVHKWHVPPNARECYPLDSRVLFRCDEDVEDVFFLDDGANVVVAVSDRGGAVFTDFRSSADAVRAPSIARAPTDFTCGDAWGTHIALGCSDGTVLVYDHRQLGRPLLSLDAHIRIVNRLEFNKSGAVRDSFASCGEDGTVVIWRMQPLQGDAACDPTDSHVIMRHIPHMCDVKDVCFCPHEEWLLASCSWSINDEYTTQGSIHYWRPHVFLTASEEDALKQVGSFLENHGI